MRNTMLIMLVIVVIVLSPFSVYAADPIYRFMHNDHDALIIGEIVSTENDFCTIMVKDTVINVKGWDLSQIKPEIVLIPLDTFHYTGFDDRTPQAGDYVLASVCQKDKSKNTFGIVHGAYFIDDLDKSNLSVIISNDATDGLKMDAAMIKCFINSDGEYSEFSIDGVEARLDLDAGSHISIYPVYPSKETLAKIGIPANNTAAVENVSNRASINKAENYDENKAVVPVQNKAIAPAIIIIVFFIMMMVITTIYIKIKRKR